VAYAVRAGRRVQPLFDVSDDRSDRDRHLLAVERALTIAESYVTSDEIEDAYDAYANAAYAAGHAAGNAAGAAANAAGYAGYTVGNAAAAAVNAAGHADNAASVAGSQDEFTAAARQDFERLKARRLGKYPEPGQAFSLSTRSFLGKLWPNGEPDWYRSALRKMRKTLKEAAAAEQSEPAVSTTSSAAENAKASAEKPDEVKREIKSIWKRLEEISGAPEQIDDLKAAISELTTRVGEISSKAAIGRFQQMARDALMEQAETLTRMQKQQSDLQKSLTEMPERIEAAKQSVTDLQGQLESRISEQFSGVEERLANSREEINKAVASYEEAVTNALGTHEADQYWETKATGHKKQFKWWAIGAGCLAAGGLTLAWWLWWCFLREITDLHPWSVGLAAFTVTVALLILRLLTRIAMSNLHLETEADERIVLMKSYTRLCIDDRLTPEHRALALHALFRPSTTGLVKEDAVPPSMLDLATRIAGPGKTGSSSSG